MSSTEIVDLETNNNDNDKNNKNDLVESSKNVNKQHNVTIDVTNPGKTTVTVNINGYFNQQNKTLVEVGGDELAVQNGEEKCENFLFDSSLLDQLDFGQFQGKFKPEISPLNAGQGLKMRPLTSQDFHKGYFQLLGQLTQVGDVTESTFLERFHEMKSRKNTYFITVIEDLETNQVIGAATLVVELKFARNCAKRALVEDVVVSDQYRGRQLGKLLVATLIQLAQSINCYKVTLNCTDNMIKFYVGMGFKQEPGDANFLALRYPQ